MAPGNFLAPNSRGFARTKSPSGSFLFHAYGCFLPMGHLYSRNEGGKHDEKVGKGMPLYPRDRTSRSMKAFRLPAAVRSFCLRHAPVTQERTGAVRVPALIRVPCNHNGARG
jgi:hypothetical protein